MWVLGVTQKIGKSISIRNETTSSFPLQYPATGVGEYYYLTVIFWARRPPPLPAHTPPPRHASALRRPARHLPAPRQADGSSHILAACHARQALVFGGRSCILFLIWHVVVIPRLPKAAQAKANIFARAFQSISIRSSDAVGSEGGPEAQGEEGEDSGMELSELMRSEVLFFTGLGIRAACRYE